MMKIYSTTAAGTLEQLTTIAHNSWIDLVNPTEAEMNQVINAVNIPLSFLTDSLDIDERPRLAVEDGSQLIIIHVPYEREEIAELHVDVKYRTVPLGIILAKDHFITISKYDIPFLDQLLEEKKTTIISHMKTRNTLTVIAEVSKMYVQCIEKIEREIVVAEQELAKSYRNEELYVLLYLNESLLYMTTSLKQMQFVMHKIKSGYNITLYEADDDILEDAMVELEQAFEVGEINQFNLNNIMDAYGNVIQNNVNRVLKLLAAVTIVLSIPTLIASIYGMNVPLPFQDEPSAFIVIIGTMVVLSGITSIVFFKKRYF